MFAYDVNTAPLWADIVSWQAGMAHVDIIIGKICRWKHTVSVKGPGLLLLLLLLLFTEAGGCRGSCLHCCSRKRKPNSTESVRIVLFTIYSPIFACAYY